MNITDAELENLLKNPHVKVHDPYHVTVIDRLTGKELPEVTEKGIQVKPPKQLAKGKMTGAEIEAGNMLRMEFAGCKVVFHGLAFYLDNGHRYTADWCVHLPEGKILVVEVKQEGKNGFRQQSYRSARIMFDQAKLEWAMFQFRWMTKKKSGWEF